MQYWGMELANWFNIGVQIFLCISGYLYGQQHIKDDIAFYIKQIKKILIPYYIVLIPVIIIRMLFFPEEGFGIVRVAGILMVHSIFSGGGHLWFVPAILMCYIMTPFLERWFGRKDHKSVFLLAEMALIFGIVFGFFYTYFNPAWMSCYLIGYFLGYSLSRENECNYCFAATASAVLSLMNIVQIFIDYILRLEFSGKMAVLYGFWRNYNHVWLGITIFIILKWLFDRCSISVTVKKVTSILEKYSYEGYLVHQFIILGPMTLMDLTTSAAVNIMIILALIGVMAYSAKKIEITIMKKI